MNKLQRSRQHHHQYMLQEIVAIVTLRKLIY